MALSSFETGLDAHKPNACMLFFQEEIAAHDCPEFRSSMPLCTPQVSALQAQLQSLALQAVSAGEPGPANALLTSLSSFKAAAVDARDTKPQSRVWCFVVAW
jgi:hypothetical protein